MVNWNKLQQNIGPIIMSTLVVGGIFIYIPLHFGTRNLRGVSDLRQQINDAESWSGTQGLVIESHTTTETYIRYIEECDDYECVTIDSNTGYNTIIHFTYTYTVDSIQYNSSQYSLCNGGVKESQLNTFTLGKAVDVYYDPNDPSFSVLNNEERGCIAGKIIFGWILTVFGSLVLLTFLYIGYEQFILDET